MAEFSAKKMHGGRRHKRRFEMGSKIMNPVTECLKNEPLIETIWIPDDKEVQSEYLPRTALGRKLVALRRTYIESGGKLLNESEFEAELHARRGGINDAEA
jgi:hypothetical protein